jgi:hypothetical protein
MSELPPEVAVESEPSDGDPPPETIRPDRPRIWPEEPRAPRPQIKRPMEEWLSEFEERVKRDDRQPREPASGRRRRPRGLARIIPVAARPEQTRQPAAERGSRQAGDQLRRGRRRRRGRRGVGEQGPEAATQGQSRTSQPRPTPPATRQPRRERPPRPQGRYRQPPAGGQPEARPPSATGSQGGLDQPGDPQRRRRRRGRGRGRGPRPGQGGSGPGPNVPPNQPGG